MVHTSSLQIPVVEALQFQNILAGWPIGLAIWLAFKLWPWARNALKLGTAHPAGLLIVASALLLSVIIVRAEVLVFARDLSVYVNAVLLSGIFFVANVVFLYIAYAQKVERMKPLFRAACVYSLGAFLILAYTVFAYRKVPQTIGGGHPVQVQLYLRIEAPSGRINFL